MHLKFNAACTLFVISLSAVLNRLSWNEEVSSIPTDDEKWNWKLINLCKFRDESLAWWWWWQLCSLLIARWPQSFFLSPFTDGTSERSREQRRRRNFCCRKMSMAPSWFVTPRADTTIIRFRVSETDVNFNWKWFNDDYFAVRDGDTVKHYRIRQLDEGGFFIARRTTFRWEFNSIFNVFLSLNFEFPHSELSKNLSNITQKTRTACAWIFVNLVFR